MIPRICKFAIYTCIALINLLTVLFACRIIFEFNDYFVTLLTSIAFYTLCLFGFFVITNAVLTLSIKIPLSAAMAKMHKTLNYCTIVTFIFFAVVFTIFVAFDLQPGTDEYMELMFPGFLPIIIGLFLNLANRN